MASIPVGNERYTRGAIAFHWTIAALIVCNLWLGLFHDDLPSDWKVMPVHKAVGISILALTIARIGWRLAHRAPPPPRDLPRWQQLVARATHYLLYFLMLAMPLTGWAMSSGPKPRPLTWFGLFDIPYLPVSKAGSGWSHDAHALLGWGLIALLALHVAAALYHHFLLRDNVLVRMAPVPPLQKNSRAA